MHCDALHSLSYLQVCHIYRYQPLEAGSYCELYVYGEEREMEIDFCIFNTGSHALKAPLAMTPFLYC